MDGRELTKQMKADTRYKAIPVLLDSAGTYTDDPQISCGANGFIAKSFDTPELIMSLRNLCSSGLQDNNDI